MSEEIKVPKILICVLTTYERSGWPHPKLLEFVYTLPYNMDYATRMVSVHNCIPAAGARNWFCENMLLSDPQPDWILMLDNDMSPPANLLDTIKDAPADAAVIVPRFHLWDHDAGTTKICWGFPDAAFDESKKLEMQPKFYELTKCGTGAIFIKPEVFRKVPRPWFFYTIDEMQRMIATEDVNFSLKVIEHGFKIYGNAKVEVGHHHTVDLMRLNGILYKNVDKPDNPVAESESKQAESPSEASVVAVESPSS